MERRRYYGIDHMIMMMAGSGGGEDEGWSGGRGDPALLQPPPYPYTQQSPLPSSSGSLMGSHRALTSEEIYTPVKGKSKVWKHFGFYKRNGQLDKTKVVCKVCRNAVRYTGSTTNLMTHLARKHRINSGGVSALPFLAKALAEGEPRGRPRGDNAGPDPSKVLKAKNVKAITDAITYFVCKAPGITARNLDLVEDEAFANLLQTLEPRYSLPDKAHFAELEIPRLYDRVKVGIMESLQAVPNLSLSLVTSVDPCGPLQELLTTIYVKAQYIDVDWTIKALVLDAIRGRPMEGRDLGSIVQKTALDWNIGHKDIVVVSPDGDFSGAMALFGGAKVSPHVRCILSTLDSASKNMLEVVETVSDVLVKARRFVNSLKGQLDLVWDSRNWCSTLHMLERLWEEREAMVYPGDHLAGEAARNSFTKEDLALVGTMVKLMTPVKTAMTLLKDEKSSMLSMVSPIQTKLVRCFQPQEGDSKVLSMAKEQFLKEFGGCYKHLQGLLNVASALDPRFKDLHFLDEETKALTLAEMRTEIAQLMESKEKEFMVKVEPLDGDPDPGTSREYFGDKAGDAWCISSSNDAAPVASGSSKKTAFDEMFGDLLTPPSSELKKTNKDPVDEEIAKYRDRRGLTEGSVIEWWKQQKDLPLLSVLARKYLAIPGTANSSAIAPISGSEKDCPWTEAESGLFNQLVFLKENLKLEHIPDDYWTRTMSDSYAS